VRMHPRIQRTRGIQHHRSPGMGRLILTEIQKEFGKEATVELRVPLKLDFDEEERPGRLGSRRQEDAVKAKSGLFEFDGGEAVGRRVVRSVTDQLKQKAGKGVKQTIEEAVGFHGKERVYAGPALTQGAGARFRRPG